MILARRARRYYPENGQILLKIFAAEMMSGRRSGEIEY